jgi:hypothetical protein
MTLARFVSFHLPRRTRRDENCGLDGVDAVWLDGVDVVWLDGVDVVWLDGVDVVWLDGVGRLA